jgi:hypothetical protein
MAKIRRVFFYSRRLPIHLSVDSGDIDMKQLVRLAAGSTFIVAFFAMHFAHAADTLKMSITGDTLSINGGEQKLGAAHWAKPEESWRTVGELTKTALPPADNAGRRPDVTLLVEIDAKASWGALKTVLIATANLGIEKAQITPKGGTAAALTLPGAEAKGDTVELPLSAGTGDDLMTENGGKKVVCNAATIAGLTKQLPKAVIVVKAGTDLPASKVVRVLGLLKQNNANVSFLGLRAATSDEAASRQEAKDAVDKALQGAMGGMGGN